jgi:AraC-like DNA-binding protein
MLSFNMDEISAIMNDINLITKIKFDLYDENFNILHGDNRTMCSLCSLVRTCDDCHKKCIESDREGFYNSQRLATSYTYKCHMGLTENVTPVVCDGKIVGYIMMGQKLMRDDYDNVKNNIMSFPDPLKRGEMLAALDKMKYTSLDELNAVRNLVDMCASYLRMKKLIKYKETPVSVQLEHYISEHISEDMDIKKLCKEFKMSKSSLYLISTKNFGKGITEYVAEIRMNKAAELLRTTADPVSSVAEAVGYSDSNYFTKVFKKHFGIPPLAWRKSLENKN